MKKDGMPALGNCLTSEAIYKDQMQGVIRQRSELESKLRQPNQAQIEKLQTLNFEKVASDFKQRLIDMPYEDKLFTVRKIVDKVIATKEQVIICCQLPVLDHLTDTQVQLHVEHRHSRSS